MTAQLRVNELDEGSADIPVRHIRVDKNVHAPVAKRLKRKKNIIANFQIESINGLMPGKVPAFCETLSWPLSSPGRFSISTATAMISWLLW